MAWKRASTGRLDAAANNIIRTARATANFSQTAQGDLILFSRYIDRKREALSGIGNNRGFSTVRELRRFDLAAVIPGYVRKQLVWD